MLTEMVLAIKGTLFQGAFLAYSIVMGFVVGFICMG
jgi:hypothetical protein